MTLSVFLRNPAKCRGPERSASGLRAGALPSAHPADAAALHPAQRQEAMLLTAWLPALRGWCTVVRFWCRGSRATGGLIQECGAHEHQRASAAEAVQRIIEIIFVRLIIVSKGRCRNGGFQGLQQISKLNRRNCQLLPDDGTNCFPQAFIGGRLAVIGIDRRNNQRTVGQAALCVKLTQLPARWLDCPMPARVRT